METKAKHQSPVWAKENYSDEGSSLRTKAATPQLLFYYWDLEENIIYYNDKYTEVKTYKVKNFC